MDEEILSRNQKFNVRLLAFAFLFTTFSGAIRKWVLTDTLSSNFLLAVQIVLPIIFTKLSKTKKLNQATLIIIMGYSLLLIAMAFNPFGKTILHGLLGYFLHIGPFLPLLVYLNDRDAFPIESLNWIFLTIAGFECALGIIQFMSPSTSFINQYVRDMGSEGMAMLHTVQRVRITGTYSYIGGLGNLLFFYGLMVWGMWLLKGNTFKAYYLLCICAIITPMTGSRGASAYLILFFSLGILSNTKDLRKSLFLLLMLGLSFWWYQRNQVSLVNEAYSGINERIEGHLEDGEMYVRVFGPIEEIIDFKGKYPLFGTGLGGTYQGAIALFGESLYLKDYGYYEEEPERIILEGGYLLFFIRFLIWSFIFYQSRIPIFFSFILLYLTIFNSAVTYNVFGAFYTFFGFIYLDKSYYLREITKPLNES